MSSCSLSLSIVAGLLACGFAAPAALSQTRGSIAGTLVGDDGKPVAGFVSVNQAAPSAAGGRVQATSNGAFSIPDLPAGTYTLCAAVENLGYLDPCSWSLQPTTVPVAAGRTVTGIRLVVKKGTALQVCVNDPDKILGRAAGPNQPGPRLLLGIFTPRRLFQPLQLVSTDSNGRTHQGLVLLDAPATSLYVNGRGMRILDHSGAEVGPEGKNIPVLPGNGNSPRVITLTVRDPGKQ